MYDYSVKSPYFNFETGDFVIIKKNPKIVVGVSRIKQYIEKIIRTKTGMLMYDTYGSDVSNLIGKEYPIEYLKSEIKRVLETALLMNEDIKSVSIDDIAINDSVATITITCNTIFGKLESEVTT